MKRKKAREVIFTYCCVALLGGCCARCNRCLMDVAIEGVRMSEDICLNSCKACERDKIEAAEIGNRVCRRMAHKCIRK